MKTLHPTAHLAFVIEMDRLKGVLRKTLLHDGSRLENSAEHSWHLATAVLVCAELANEPIDVTKAVKMALVHDVVEIDSGDIFIYDYAGNKDAAAEKYQRESKAAQRLFGLLPQELGEELRQLWEAYEKMDTPEAKFVYALDRLLPLIANCKNNGHSWKKHGISLDRVIKHNRKIDDGSHVLWDYAEQLIAEGVRQGQLS
jgi:putative hydrolase of HD superfamily